MSPRPLAVRSGIAESQSRLPPGLFRGVPPRQICVFFMREVRFDFLGEIPILLGTIDKSRHAHLLVPTAYSNDSPRMRPMARVILRQRPAAAFSSFRPLLVSR